ncbi:MAG: hypothetical protein ACTSSH_02105, partial [Candidatus Heimdallarchaeota archaeon]
MDSIVTNDYYLNWDNRFGDFTGGLNTLRLKHATDYNATLIAFEAGTIDIMPITGRSDKITEYRASSD